MKPPAKCNFCMHTATR